MKQVQAGRLCATWQGDRLLEVRVTLDYTQRELSERTGLSVDRIKMLEGGTVKPTTSELTLLCKEFRAPSWLFSTPSSKPRQKLRGVMVRRAQKRRAKLADLIEEAKGAST